MEVAGPAKRIKVEGGWPGQPESALPSGAVFLACPALPCPALPCPALPCPALPCPAQPNLTQTALHCHAQAFPFL